MIMVTVGGRIVAGAMDVGVVTFEERSSGTIGAYVSWLGGDFQLERVNGNKRIF